MAEIGRLANDLSRRLRSSKSFPEAKNILALSRLLNEYNEMVSTGEGPEDKKHTQEYIRQHGQGYEVAMGLNKK